MEADIYPREVQKRVDGKGFEADGGVILDREVDICVGEVIFRPMEGVNLPGEVQKRVDGGGIDADGGVILDREVDICVGEVIFRPMDVFS